MVDREMVDREMVDREMVDREMVVAMADHAQAAPTSGCLVPVDQAARDRESLASSSAS